MKKLFILLFAMTLFASPAIPLKRVFIQPDRTSFEGYLKGDSSFHWIESDGDIIIYNPQDKYYYKAIVDKNKGVVSSGIRYSKKQKMQGSSSRSASVSQETKEVLRFLHKQAKKQRQPKVVKE